MSQLTPPKKAVQALACHDRENDPPTLIRFIKYETHQEQMRENALMGLCRQLKPELAVLMVPCIDFLLSVGGWLPSISQVILHWPGFNPIHPGVGQRVYRHQCNKIRTRF